MPREDSGIDGRQQYGFTLVELLIVIVILGILAGIVVFAVGNLNSGSDSTACKTEAKQFVDAYAAYQANHNGTTVAGPTTANMVSQLKTDGELSQSSAKYLDSSQGGPATANPRWTFSGGSVVTDQC